MSAEIRDAIAGRVVDAWLDAIEAQAADARTREPIMARGLVRKIGPNPATQKAWVSRVQAAYDPVLLGIEAHVGKRAKYSICVTHVTAWRTVLTFIDGSGVATSEARPAHVLAVQSSRLTRGGVRDALHVHSAPACVFTRHSIVRLMQRGGCHTVEEVKDVVAEIWQRAAFAGEAFRQHSVNDAHATWLVPVRASTHEDPLVLVMSGCFDAGDEWAPVVKTVLRLEHVAERHLDAIDALDDFLAQNEGDEPFELTDEARQLVLACRA